MWRKLATTAGPNSFSESDMISGGWFASHLISFNVDLDYTDTINEKLSLATQIAESCSVYASLGITRSITITCFSLYGALSPNHGAGQQIGAA